MVEIGLTIWSKTPSAPPAYDSPGWLSKDKLVMGSNNISFLLLNQEPGIATFLYSFVFSFSKKKVHLRLFFQLCSICSTPGAKHFISSCNKAGLQIWVAFCWHMLDKKLLNCDEFLSLFFDFPTNWILPLHSHWFLVKRRKKNDVSSHHKFVFWKP